MEIALNRCSLSPKYSRNTKFKSRNDRQKPWRHARTNDVRKMIGRQTNEWVKWKDVAAAVVVLAEVQV